MPSPVTDFEAVSLLGAVLALWAMCFAGLYLYLKRMGAGFVPETTVESGVFTEEVEVANGVGRRWGYGKQISRSYGSDFSHLPPDQRRRCENAIKLATAVMMISMFGTVIYLILR